MGVSSSLQDESPAARLLNAAVELIELMKLVAIATYKQVKRFNLFGIVAPRCGPTTCRCVASLRCRSYYNIYNKQAHILQDTTLWNLLRTTQTLWSLFYRLPWWGSRLANKTNPPQQVSLSGSQCGYCSTTYSKRWGESKSFTENSTPQRCNRLHAWNLARRPRPLIL